ncbi:MAG TPA: PAC2 family protein [Egibacteraceae bacterium]|nr:PAC2 family protein [Egibacteraceae bacterium]
MDVVTIAQRPPPLRRPALVAAFKGWNDAGEAASGAASVLRREAGATAFAGIEPDEFFDFQATRPAVRIVGGGVRHIDWPQNRFSWGTLPGADGHVVVLEGVEPNLRWRAFARGVVDLATGLGVRVVVTLGALQVDVPHTRPVPVTGSASAPDLAVLGLGASTYEGPTGITGVLHHACAEAGLQAVSLWAGVPHYLAGAPYLTGALALAERAGRLLGARLRLEELARDAAAQRDDIDRLVGEDDERAEYVAELERRDAATAEGDAVDGLPAAAVSGEELAEEFERYLRDRGHE